MLPALVLAAALALAGCAGTGSGVDPDRSGSAGSHAERSAEPPRIVDTAESQRLAVMRFNNFNAGSRLIAFDANESGIEYRVEGRYDYVSHTGIGALTDSEGSSALIMWTPSFFGIHLGGAAALHDGAAPDTVPDADALETAWSIGALDPSGSVLHAVLAAVTTLGNDRPDNPLLLQQAGALFLGTGKIAGVTAAHFSGPPSDEPTSITDPAELLRESNASYWLDDENVLLSAELRVGGGSQITAVEFGDAKGANVASPFDATTANADGGISRL